jgi:hypothetical protein
MLDLFSRLLVFPEYRIDTLFLFQPDGFPTILFYPAGRKGFEPVSSYT